MYKCKVICFTFLCILVTSVQASPINVTERAGKDAEKLAAEDSNIKTPATVFKTEYHKTQNETNLERDKGKGGYLEKKGGNGEVVYVTKFHRAGTGGYDHYEAFHTKDNGSYARAKLNSSKKDKENEKEVASEKAENYSEADYNSDDDGESNEHDVDPETQSHVRKENAKSTEKYSPQIQGNSASTKAVNDPKLTYTNTRKLVMPIFNVKTLHSENENSDLSTILPIGKQQEINESLEQDEEKKENHRHYSMNLGKNENQPAQKNLPPKQHGKPIEKTLKGSNLYKKIIFENVSQDSSVGETTAANVSDEKDNDENSDSLEITEANVIAKESRRVEQGDKIKQIAETLIKDPPEVVIGADIENSEDAASNEDEPILTLNIGIKEKLETQIEPRPLSNDYVDNTSVERTQKTNYDNSHSSGTDLETEDPEVHEEKPKQKKKRKPAKYEVTEEPDEGDNPHEKPTPPEPALVEDQKRYRPSNWCFSDEDDLPTKYSNRYNNKHSSEEEPSREKVFSHSSIRDRKPHSSKLSQRSPGYETYILHGAEPRKINSRDLETNKNGKVEHITSQEDPAFRYLYPNFGISFKGKHELNEYYKKYHDGEEDTNESSSGSIEVANESEEKEASNMKERPAKQLTSSLHKTKPQTASKISNIEMKHANCHIKSEVESSEEHISAEKVPTENLPSTTNEKPNLAEEKLKQDDVEVDFDNATNISSREIDASSISPRNNLLHMES